MSCVFPAHVADELNSMERNRADLRRISKEMRRIAGSKTEEQAHVRMSEILSTGLTADAQQRSDELAAAYTKLGKFERGMGALRRNLCAGLSERAEQLQVLVERNTRSSHLIVKDVNASNNDTENEQLALALEAAQAKNSLEKVDGETMGAFVRLIEVYGDFFLNGAKLIAAMRNDVREWKAESERLRNTSARCSGNFGANVVDGASRARSNEDEKAESSTTQRSKPLRSTRSAPNVQVISKKAVDAANDLFAPVVVDSPKNPRRNVSNENYNSNVVSPRRRPRVFRCPLETLIGERDSLPGPVEWLFGQVEKCVSLHGVFRVSAQRSNIEEARLRLDSGLEFSFSEFVDDPFVAPDLWTEWLRDIPGSLFPIEAVRHLIAVMVKAASNSDRLEGVRWVAGRCLSPSHRLVASRVLSVLRRAHDEPANHMTAATLATMMSPYLFAQDPRTDSGANVLIEAAMLAERESKLLVFLVEEHASVFGGSFESVPKLEELSEPMYRLVTSLTPAVSSSDTIGFMSHTHHKFSRHSRRPGVETLDSTSSTSKSESKSNSSSSKKKTKGSKGLLGIKRRNK